MSGLTVSYQEWFDCQLPGCGGYTEYFTTTQPRTILTLAFLNLKTIHQNASLEAELLDLTSNLSVISD